MNKEFISYQQSKALKELGFNEKAFGYYDVDGIFTSVEYAKTCDGLNVLIPAPLWQQAFRFFREKYDLVAWIEFGLNDEIYYYFTIESLTDHTCKGSRIFPTYEEAQSSCLDKLIEIAKTKTIEPYRFVDREEAAQIALFNGQIIEYKKVLFSEDLY